MYLDCYQVLCTMTYFVRIPIISPKKTSGEYARELVSVWPRTPSHTLIGGRKYIIPPMAPAAIHSPSGAVDWFKNTHRIHSPIFRCTVPGRKTMVILFVIIECTLDSHTDTEYIVIVENIKTWLLCTLLVWPHKSLVIINLASQYFKSQFKSPCNRHHYLQSSDHYMVLRA